MFPDLGRYEKFLGLGPAVVFLGEFALVFAERSAVGAVGVGFVGRSVSDDRVDDDQGWFVGSGLELIESSLQGAQIVSIRYVDRMPAESLKFHGHVFGEGQIGVAFDGDPVVVVDPAKVREFQVTGDRSGFAGDAFHQVAIATQCVDIVVEEIDSWSIVLGA